MSESLVCICVCRYEVSFLNISIDMYICVLGSHCVVQAGLKFMIVTALVGTLKRVEPKTRS